MNSSPTCRSAWLACRSVGARPTVEQAAEYWVRYEEFGNELRSFSSVSLLTYDDYYMLIKAYQAAGTFDGPGRGG